MESEFEPVARPESLLEWVNTFKVLEKKCESFNDLSSGEVLLKCLRSVMHEEQLCNISTDPWSEVWSMLEEFCNSSLTKVISLDEVLSGNEEHIARAVVLLLCFAVQKKPNEDIIEGITSLDKPIQWNIMFFIESALAKVKSHAIASGTFTSGIGERLPSYETHELSVERLSQPSTPIANGGGDWSFVEQQPTVADEDVYKFTPAITRSSSKKVLFYDGLDSPAGTLWLKSPAITKSVLKSSLVTTVSKRIFKQTEPEDPSREVCVLGHHIRVLQNTVENQTKHIKVLQTKLDDQDNLFQECSAQLISKTEEHSSLESNYHKLLDKLQKLEEVKDLHDELDQRNADLKRVEKSLARYQAEVESLQGYKKMAVESEKKLEYYVSVESKSQDNEQRLEQVTQSLVETSSVNKRVELELKTTAIELQAKSSEMAHLLEQNKEMSKELREWTGKCKMLEEMRNNIQSTLDEKTDVEQSLLRENRELTIQLEKLQGEVANHQTELDMLTASRKSLDERHQAVLAEHLEYKSQVEGLLERVKMENEQLKTKTAILEGNIEAEQFERKEQLAKKEEEISRLKTALLTKEIEFTKYKEESEAYSASLDHEKQLMVSDIATKDGALIQTSNEKAMVEEKLGVTEQVLEEQKALVACKVDILASLSSEKASLEDKVVELITELQTQHDSYRENQTALLDVQTQLKVKEDTVSSLGSEIASLEQKLVEHTEALATKEEELSTLQTHNDEVFTMLATVERDLTECKNELSSKNAALADEKSTMEEQLSALHSDVCSLQDRINVDGKVLEECQSQLADKEAVITSLTAEKHNLEGELGTLQSKCKDFSQQQTVLQDELAEQRRKLAAKEEDLSALSTEKTSLESQLIQVQTNSTAQVVKLEMTLSDNKEELALKDSMLSSLTNERDTLKEDMLSLESQYCSKSEADSVTLALNQQRMTDLQNQVANLKEELEDMTQSRDKIKELYQQAVTELETNQKQYTSQVETLMEQNRRMQAEREEAYKRLSEDNHSILQKQNRLYEQLDDIRKREEEAINVGHEYERALRREQSMSQAMRARIDDLETDLKEKDEIDDGVVEQLQLELDMTKRRLSNEQKHLATMIVENKSLDTQLNYASQKLRSFEKSKTLSPILPKTSRQSRYEPRSTHEDEFYTHNHSEFNTVTGRCLISTLPFKMDEVFDDSTDEENTDPDNASLQLSMLSSAASYKSHASLAKLPSEKKQDRITELQRRNALALPHLKTSYPVEIQVQPENLNATNEQIKNGRPRASKKRAAHETKSTTTKPRATAFEISLDTLPEKTSAKPRNPRKRPKEREVNRFCFEGEDDGTRSPAPSRRRISAPPTPQPHNDILSSRPSAKELRRNTMAPSSFKLREFLDESDKVSTRRQAGPSEQSSTSFTVNFSPPKSEAPKRLQENKARMIKGSNSIRRATISKKKPSQVGTSTKRKTALKAKN